MTKLYSTNNTQKSSRMFLYFISSCGRLIKTKQKNTDNNFEKFVDRVWNVMTHAQKPDFVLRRNGWVHLNWWGRQFSRLLTAEVCASAVVMLDTPCSEVVWRVLATHCIRQFPLHLPSRASPCAFTFQPDSSTKFTTANYSARTHTHTHIHTLVKFSHIHTNTQKHIEQTTILNRLA